MNSKVFQNYSKLKSSIFYIPLFILFAIVFSLFSRDSLQVENYIQIQKDSFFYINAKLSQFPNAIYNLTQIGDEWVFLSFLSIFIIFAPVLWESLISASIFSAIVSFILKKSFAVPRPAAIFDNDSFVIIGKTLSGNTSLPSGHSITIFTILTILLFAFMPQSLKYKILWIALLIFTGLLLVSTRVGVGAHYPLDVLIGSVIGYISGLTGIFFNRRYRFWSWVGNIKYYPIFMFLFMICLVVLINKICHDNLIVFYLALISLVFSLFKIIVLYVKK